MSSRRTTMLPNPSRQSLLPPAGQAVTKSTNQHQVSQQQLQKYADYQKALQHYLRLSPTTVQLSAPFQHSAAVQTILERLVYEICLNQRDTNAVVTSFLSIECLQAVLFKLNMHDSNLNTIARHHHEFARGFLLSSCINYLWQPIRASVPDIPLLDWFLVTETPGAYGQYKQDIEKFKAKLPPGELRKINTSILEVLDDLLLLTNWFCQLYQALNEEFSVKLDQRERMHGIQLEIGKLKDHKQLLEETHARDAQLIEQLEKDKTDLQNQYKTLTAAGEVLSKRIVSGNQNVALSKENLDQANSSVERAERRLKDLQSQVVKNPEQLREKLEAERQNLKQVQTDKQYKLDQLMATNKRLEAFDNYAKDLQKALEMLSSSVPKYGSVAENRRKRHEIERNTNLVQAELDGLARNIADAKLQLDIAECAAKKDELLALEIIRREQVRFDNVQEEFFVVQQQLDELEREVASKESTVNVLNESIRLQKLKTDLLETRFRENLNAVQHASTTFCAECSVKQGVLENNDDSNVNDAEQLPDEGIY